MRSLIVRGAMIVAFAFMGLAGGAAELQMIALDSPERSNSIEARMPLDPEGCSRYVTGVCKGYDNYDGGWN